MVVYIALVMAVVFGGSDLSVSKNASLQCLFLASSDSEQPFGQILNSFLI